MENVYEVVSSFYWEEPDLEEIVPRREIERFLRKRAWQGDSEYELLDTWYQVQVLLEYMLTISLTDFDEMTADEYSRAIQYIEQQTDEPITLEEASDLFAAWHSFYLHLLDAKLIESINALKEAQTRMTSGDELIYLETISLTDKINSMQGELALADSEPPEFNQFLAKMVDGLLLKMSAFFQQKQFIKDFERALYFYTGPFLDVVMKKDAAFWYGFWDYFLFDYRLIQSDRTPIMLFDAEMYDMLNIEEQRVMNDLKETRFTVFYVKGSLDNGWAECSDLFTEETFALPKSELGSAESFEKKVYYGHVRTNGVVFINHIVAIEASAAVRRRIKSEILNQLSLFRCSHPNATLSEFFSRHGCAVRHLIDILSSMRNVSVMSSAHLSVMRSIGHDNAISLRLAKEIEAVVPTLSLYDKRQIGKMCTDYLVLDSHSFAIDACTIAAMVGVYLELNHNQLMRIRSVVTAEVDWEEVALKQSIIKEELSIVRFDARYLNEEGFIFSLFIL
ncbi:MAG: hypothetical protein J6K70_04095 [Selenomonadales bacterium]|nr:hypothetical protein [Selenomonadales bacterium]